jgi:hypothetical protein
MAVHEEIADVVFQETGNDMVVIVDVVIDELKHRATIPATASLAKKSLALVPPSWKRLDTTGEYPVVLLQEVLDAQYDVADGRPLTNDDQHWAESTIIAMGRRSAAVGSASIKVLLSEDFDARRVAAQVPNMEAVSIHKVLHSRVHRNELSAEQAANLAAKLEEAGRGPQVTAEDFADPTGRLIGRVVKP